MLENMFSNTQEKGGPNIVSDRKPQPGTTRQDHHKQRTTNVTCYSKTTQEMCHKFVTENGHFPKCVTSVLESFPNHSLPSQNSPLQRTRGALHLLTLLFLSRRHVPKPRHGRRTRARPGVGRRRRSIQTGGPNHRQDASRQYGGFLPQATTGHKGTVSAPPPPGPKAAAQTQSDCHNAPRAAYDGTRPRC